MDGVDIGAGRREAGEFLDPITDISIHRDVDAGHA
jgi:hypothetical protein